MCKRVGFTFLFTRLFLLFAHGFCINGFDIYKTLCISSELSDRLFIPHWTDFIVHLRVDRFELLDVTAWIRSEDVKRGIVYGTGGFERKNTCRVYIQSHGWLWFWNRLNAVSWVSIQSF